MSCVIVILFTSDKFFSFYTKVINKNAINDVHVINELLTMKWN